MVGVRGPVTFALAVAATGVTPAQPQASEIQQPSATAPVSESYATTPDGIRIYYRVAGSGEETVIAPFALYHGTAFDALANGRRVVTYDPRGRGKSQAVPPERVSLDFLLSDLETVKRAVGAEKVALIGWSGGGMETFVYALRNPQAVTRLIQLAPVTARAEPYTEEMAADRERRTNQAAREALREKIEAGHYAGDPAARCRAEAAISVPPLLADPSLAALVPDVCDYPNEHAAALGEYFGALWPSISTFDWRASLGEVTVPRLVIYPLQDNITRVGVEEWVGDQKNARILYIDGSGHLPQHEQPQVTIEAIETFLTGSWPEEAVSLASER